MQEIKKNLSGEIKSILFHSQENGAFILRLKVEKRQGSVTVTGSAPALLVGEHVKCEGTWYSHPKYGEQFKATLLEILHPNTLEGKEKYLGAGLIKGIGPYLAKKLTLKFGEKVFEIIEDHPHLLRKVEGIGKIKAKSIRSSWQEKKGGRESMTFLLSHGISATKAVTIVKKYGEKTIEEVSANPYTLAKDITGIGFSSADAIAERLGIAKDAPIRVRAGLTHLLREALSAGHCALPLGLLIQKTQVLLAVTQDLVALAIEEEIAEGTIVRDAIGGAPCIFLAAYHLYEQQIAGRLLATEAFGSRGKNHNAHELLPQIEKELAIKLSDNQQEAIIRAASEKVMVITGGPGTGKTTLIKSLLNILAAKKLDIKLCAPTGRAARRLGEGTGLEATTIHRLLEANSYGFGYHVGNRLPCDYLIIDESAMIDVKLFYALVTALQDHAGLLLVGDVDQLPPVGAGQVLKDIINTDAITTIRLTDNFRQAATSDIITHAHHINKGIFPHFGSSLEETDFYFIETKSGEDITEKIMTLVTDRIPKKFNLSPLRDIQVLCPMQRGQTGVKSLNTALQRVLNPKRERAIEKFDQVFAVGDKVMQTKNNYDKEVYNGEAGLITDIYKGKGKKTVITVTFDSRQVVYDYAELDQITLAYAMTIHKSQGSEYPAVVIPLTMQNYAMLKRNLIYAAVTRGKKLVVVIGEEAAFRQAVRDDGSSKRHTKLADWLEAGSVA